MKLMKLLAIISLCVTVTSQSTLAETSCQEVIKAADKALAAKQKEVDLCMSVNVQLNQYNSELDRQLTEQKDKLNSPIRNPFIVATVGVVLGLVIGAYVRK